MTRQKPMLAARAFLVREQRDRSFAKHLTLVRAETIRAYIGSRVQEAAKRN